MTRHIELKNALGITCLTDKICCSDWKESESPVTGRHVVIDVPIFPFAQCCTMMCFPHSVCDICSCWIIHMTKLWDCQSLGNVFLLPLSG